MTKEAVDRLASAASFLAFVMMFVFGHQLWLANTKLREIRQEQINRTRRVYDMDAIKERTTTIENHLTNIIEKQGEIIARQTLIIEGRYDTQRNPQ